jgi:hypothetical protein
MNLTNTATDNLKRKNSVYYPEVFGGVQKKKGSIIQNKNKTDLNK